MSKAHGCEQMRKLGGMFNEGDAIEKSVLVYLGKGTYIIFAVADKHKRRLMCNLGNIDFLTRIAQEGSHAGLESLERRSRLLAINNTPGTGENTEAGRGRGRREG